MAGHLLGWRKKPNPNAVQPLAITLRGITNDGRDPSVDAWRAVTLPLLRQLTGAEGGFDLKINRRGAPPSVRSFAPARQKEHSQSSSGVILQTTVDFPGGGSKVIGE